MPVKTGNAEVRAPQFGLVQLLWQGVGAGAAALSAQTPSNACGFVVTRTGVGAFDMVFDEKWAGGCVFLKGMLYNDGTPVGCSVELSSKYDAATKTLSFDLLDVAAANQDVPVGNELWLEVTMSNRDIAPPLTPA